MTCAFPALFPRFYRAALYPPPPWKKSATQAHPPRPNTPAEHRSAAKGKAAAERRTAPMANSAAHDLGTWRHCAGSTSPQCRLGHAAPLHGREDHRSIWARITKGPRTHPAVGRCLCAAGACQATGYRFWRRSHETLIRALLPIRTRAKYRRDEVST
jgi:hypothetical protein